MRGTEPMPMNPFSHTPGGLLLMPACCLLRPCGQARGHAFGSCWSAVLAGQGGFAGRDDVPECV